MEYYFGVLHRAIECLSLKADCAITHVGSGKIRTMGKAVGQTIYTRRLRDIASGMARENHQDFAYTRLRKYGGEPGAAKPMTKDVTSGCRLVGDVRPGTTPERCGRGLTKGSDVLAGVL